MASRALLSLLVLAFNPVSALWPAPANYTSGTTRLWLKQDIAVTYNGASLSYQADYEPTSFGDTEIVTAGLSRALGSIFTTAFVPWVLHPRGKLSSFEPALNSSTGTVTSLAITTTSSSSSSSSSSNSSSSKPAALAKASEAYGLTISEDGSAKLTAASAVGVLRGLTTFSQLFYQHSAGGAWYMASAPVAITDKPTYAHRGVMLDTSRHFFALEHIERTIDAMEMNKMNKLHVHVTDSQSWPLEVPALPELAAKGAYSANTTYSPDDVQGLQEYGLYRGVEVYLEIDMPGHSGVVAEAYPDLVVAYNAYPYTYYCAQPPCGALRLNNSDVSAFLEKLLGDVLPRVSPYTGYFHTGGDEYNANNSLLDPALKTGDAAALQPLVQAFVDRNLAQVRAAGLTPLVWEEMSSTWNVSLGNDTVVQTWLGGTALQDLTAAGHRVIDSNYNYWYLDCGRGQWLTFANSIAQGFYPYNDWCTPTKSWELMYSHDPAAGLPAAQSALVLGGEVAVWSETIDPANLDSLVWPRAASAAEVLWSGRVDPATGANRSQVDAVPRLNEQRERMVAGGVGASPIQQQWCLMVNVSDCSYPAV